MINDWNYKKIINNLHINYSEKMNNDSNYLKINNK